MDHSVHAHRRQRLLASLEDAAVVLPAAHLVTHHADVHHRFRQDSDFFYLCGLDEANAVALLRGHGAGGPRDPRFVLFVEPRDATAEVWNGHRWGAEGAMEYFDAEAAHPVGELAERLDGYLQGADRIGFRVGRHPHVEPLVLRVWAQQLERGQRHGGATASLFDASAAIHAMRLRKEPGELERMREAARISCAAHEQARQAVRAGMGEYQIEALVEGCFRNAGARQPAYPSIVAGGDNGCILHYTNNQDLLRDGDLLLIDAGCSLMDYYNADITRTFPINGRFSGEQRALYELVLTAQRRAIAAVQPGSSSAKVHNAAVAVLVDGLLELGLLQGDREAILTSHGYRHLYPHRTGHWLGLDVHDVGASRLGEHHTALEPGMVLTVEPGLYLSNRLPVPEGQPPIPENWQGIGIRIEDDVAVTESGHEVLTAAALKDVGDME
ncbi:MAG: M24 family metallopeptidase, partial [Synechococcus sp. SB0677_bin_5]|nr:M24 family metallopeptidase [Synechococcus sp. SB0677_bin_5]